MEGADHQSDLIYGQWNVIGAALDTLRWSRWASSADSGVGSWKHEHSFRPLTWDKTRL